MAWHRVPTIPPNGLRAVYGEAFADISRRRGLSVVAEQWYPTTERVVGTVIDAAGSRPVTLRFCGDTLVATRCICDERGHCDHVLALICAVSGKVLPVVDVAKGEDGGDEWRHAAQLLATARDSDNPTGGKPEPRTRVALIFALSATDGVIAAPVVPGPYGQGEWTLTGVHWQDFAPSAPLGRFDIAQHLLLTGLYRLADRPLAWLNLSIAGSDVWPLLQSVNAAGVDLLEAASAHSGVVMPRGDVELHDDLEVVAVASERARSAVAVHLTVRYGQTIVRDNHFGLLGPRNQVHGIYWSDSLRLHLGPIPQMPSAAHARLLERGEPLIVPRAHIRAFTSDHMEHIGVTVVDPQHALTTIDVDGPTAVLRIERIPAGFTDDEDTFLIRWTVRYWLDGEPRDHPPSTAPVESFRDRERENQLWAGLDSCLHAVSECVDHDGNREALSAADLWRERHCYATTVAPLIGEVLPTFEGRDDLIVDVDDQIPNYQPTDATPTVRFGTSPDGVGRDWLNLTITVQIGDDQIPIDTLIRELASGHDRIILPSGSYITAELPAIMRLARLIREARDVNELSYDGKVPADTANATLWDDILDHGEVDSDIADWAESKKVLALNSSPQRIPVPATVHAQLRDYQRDGFDWLTFLVTNNTGGILADDMGLGKTLQLLSTMAHILQSQPDATFLVIAPTSVVGNWAAEAARFVPSMTVAAVRAKTKPGADPTRERIAAATLVVTTYALVRLDPGAYSQTWTMVVADEAQAVKNDKAKTHSAIRSLTSATKIAATGTPIENDLMDLAALLTITTPNLFPDRQKFVNRYRQPIVKQEDAERLAELKRRIRPFMLRRTKEEVLGELPPKQAQKVLINLSATHRTIYDRRLNLERQKSLELLSDDPKHARFQVLAALTRLRQLSLHAGLVDDAALTVGSAKVDYLTAQLPQLSKEGHRSLVFSSFPTFLRLLQPQLEEVGLRVCYLAGELSPHERTEQISTFTRDGADVFLISLKAGGSGLNLTQADYVFLTDPWWNPAAEDQAIDRAHRIGQTRPVNVIRLVADDSIEGKVVDLQSSKRHLAEAALGGEQSFAAALTDDDIRSLLL